MNLRRVVALVGAGRQGPDGPYPDGVGRRSGTAPTCTEPSTRPPRRSPASASHATRVERGRLWLDLARQFAGQGPVPASVVQLDLARAAAASAIDDLYGGVAPQNLKAAHGEEDFLPRAERCRAWLDLVSAMGLSWITREDGGDHRLLIHALNRATEAAGSDTDLRFECHTRTARVHWDRYERTGDPALLDRAVDAWEPAVRLLPEDDPRLPVVLTDHGTALHRRGERHDAAQDAHRAVDVLRRAVDETHPDDPELPARRHLLAAAHVGRYRHAHVLSDLYEADWLLGEVVRAAEEPRFLARCLICAAPSPSTCTTGWAPPATWTRPWSTTHAAPDTPARRTPTASPPWPCEAGPAPGNARPHPPRPRRLPRGPPSDHGRHPRGAAAHRHRPPHLRNGRRVSDPTDETEIPLPVLHRPARTDHPVLAAVLAELRVRDGETTVVAHYEDAP